MIRRQRGIALITVLLVVALATIAAVEMSRDAVFDRRRTANRLALEQAHQVALGGESWAIAILKNDVQEEGEDEENTGYGAGQQDDQKAEDAVDSLDETWAQPIPPIPIAGGQITGRIIDAQSRFNINSLVGEGGVHTIALMRFQRLLALLGLDRRIAMAVVDWIDRDDRVTHPGGAEDAFYRGLDEPYPAANRPMTTASELRLVRRMDAGAWRTLRPYVTALRGGAPINVNTAGPVILRTLVPDLRAEAAEKLAEKAAKDPFANVAAFLKHELVAGTGANEVGIAVQSSHFRSRVDVEIGPMQYTLYSWLRRDDNGRSHVVRRARTPN